MDTKRIEEERRLANDLLNNTSTGQESRIVAHTAIRLLDLSERFSELATNQGRIADALIALEAENRRDRARFDRLLDVLERHGLPSGSSPNLHAVRAPIGDEG